MLGVGRQAAQGALGSLPWRTALQSCSCNRAHKIGVPAQNVMGGTGKQLRATMALTMVKHPALCLRRNTGYLPGYLARLSVATEEQLHLCPAKTRSLLSVRRKCKPDAIPTFM